MSNPIPPYEAGQALPKTLAAFRRRACAKPFDQGYQPPTPDEITALIQLAGWSQNDTARLVGVSFNPKKGSTSVRRWRAPTASYDYREIAYAPWRLLLLYAGVVTIDDGLAAIAKPGQAAE